MKPTTTRHLVIIGAACAANLALFVEIGRTHGEAARWLGAGMAATGLAFAALVGLVLRLGWGPVAVMQATAALTEALLWRSVADGREPPWVRDFTLAGALLLGLALWAGRWLRRGAGPRARRTDGPDGGESA